MTTATRTNLFTNPAFTATRTPLVVARNLFINPVLGNATPELHWAHNAGGATVNTSVVGSGGVDPAVPFRRMHFDTDSTSYRYASDSTLAVELPTTSRLLRAWFTQHPCMYDTTWPLPRNFRVCTLFL